MFQSLYPHLALFHRLFAGFVLTAAIAATGVAFSGWRANKRPSASLLRLAVIYVLAMDLELVSGLLIYLGASPAVRSAFTVHGVLMVLAVICAHIGGASARKAPTDMLKSRGAAIVWTISLILMLAGLLR